MTYFNFKLTAEIQDHVSRVISGILPHNNFRPELSHPVLASLFRTVPIEETYGILYVFLKMFRNLSVLNLYMSGYNQVLRREVFEQAVQSGVTNLIQADAFEAKQFFSDYGKQFDLSVPSELFDAASFVYTLAMEMYDDLFELAIPTEECETWLQVTRDAMEQSIMEKMISIAAQALSTGYQYDKVVYRTPQDVQKLLSLMSTDVTVRLARNRADIAGSGEVSTVSSFEESKLYDDKHFQDLTKLYYLGFEPVDAKFAMHTQDIGLLVADEGVGKTRWMIDQLYKAIIQGVNCIFVCGETKELEAKKRLEAEHIFQMYNLQLSYKELLDISKLNIEDLDALEDIKIKIASATADLYDAEHHGTVSFMQRITYEDCYQEIKDAVDATDAKLVFIDHVLAMEASGELTSSGRLHAPTQRISFLFEKENLLVKDLNIAFMNASHPSSELTKLLAQGKRPGKRVGAESSNSSRYATAIFVLTNNLEMQSQDLVSMFIPKLRSDEPITDEIVLYRNGYGNYHSYDPNLQDYATTTFGLSEEEALFMDMYEEEE